MGCSKRQGQCRSTKYFSSGKYTTAMMDNLARRYILATNLQANLAQEAKSIHHKFVEKYEHFKDTLDYQGVDVTEKGQEGYTEVYSPEDPEDFFRRVTEMIRGVMWEILSLIGNDAPPELKKKVEKEIEPLFKGYNEKQMKDQCDIVNLYHKPFHPGDGRSFSKGKVYDLTPLFTDIFRNFERKVNDAAKIVEKYLPEVEEARLKKEEEEKQKAKKKEEDAVRREEEKAKKKEQDKADKEKATGERQKAELQNAWALCYHGKGVIPVEEGIATAMGKKKTLTRPDDGKQVEAILSCPEVSWRIDAYRKNLRLIAQDLESAGLATEAKNLKRLDTMLGKESTKFLWHTKKMPSFLVDGEWYFEEKDVVESTDKVRKWLTEATAAVQEAWKTKELAKKKEAFTDSLARRYLDSILGR